MPGVIRMRVLNAFMLFAVAIVAVFSQISKTYAGPDHFEVKTGVRQLFLDGHGIRSLDNLKRTLHFPRKLGAVIRPRYLTTEESSLQIRSAPQWDAPNQRYLLWLISASCYESKDGLHWIPTTPQPDTAVMHVIIDPDEPDSHQRFKGLKSVPGGLQPVISSDGLHWTKLDVPLIPSQDESNLSYDRNSHTFIATVKHRGPYGRTVWLSTSKDFREWSKPELIFHPDATDQQRAVKHITDRMGNADLQPLFQNDPKDYNVQVYNMGLFRYEGHYVGMPSMFHSTGKMPNYPNTDGFHLIQLVSSRNMKNWNRLGDRQTFIGPSSHHSGAFDLTQLIPPSRPILREQELWFYYTGLKYRGNWTYVGEFPNGEHIPMPDTDRAKGAICLAVLRRDGFVSLDAVSSCGSVTTEPFILPTNKLRLNINSLQGSCKIELLHNNSVVAQSHPVNGDHPSVAVTWQYGNLQKFCAREVQLRVTLDHARIYSYWFAP